MLVLRAAKSTAIFMSYDMICRTDSRELNSQKRADTAELECGTTNSNSQEFFLQDIDASPVGSLLKLIVL